MFSTGPTCGFIFPLTQKSYNRKMRIPTIEGEYYHIYNRGNGKRTLFDCHEDYDRFMKLLYICNSENSFKFRDSVVEQKIDAWDFERGIPLVDISAWVLMPNHFHILVSSHRSDLWAKGQNPITEFMRRLSTAYVMYFNNKYQRTGSLFEGKFKSKHVGKDNYFNYLFSYIHLNPIKLIQKDWKEIGIYNISRALDYLKNFSYSSFPDYFNRIQRKESCIIAKTFFDTSDASKLFEWIESSPQVGPVGNSKNTN